MSMMIHRHFEGRNSESPAALADVTPSAAEDEPDIFAALAGNDTEEAPKRRGRPRKADTEIVE